jgi:glutathione S-transferase
MSLKLVIASLNYSSWSVRPFLALTHAGAPFSTHEIKLFNAPDWKEQILRFSGAGKVPILLDGALSVHEALAICEYTAELYPAAQLWPEDRKLRARARAISSEMAASFVPMRSAMAMNVRGRSTRFVPDEAVQADIARVLDIWGASLDSSGGPFLFGAFSIADCMYAPVVSRFRTYGIALDGHAARYAAALWEQPAVKRWTELAEHATLIAAYDALL